MSETPMEMEEDIPQNSEMPNIGGVGTPHKQVRFLQTGILGRVVMPPRPYTVAIPNPVKGSSMDMSALARACNELGPSGELLKSVPEEDKEYLDPVLHSDYAKEMQNAINELEDVQLGYENSNEKHLNALEILIDYVDDINAAIDCVNIGGVFTCIDCLKSKVPEIRAAACTLIAEIVQNNQYALGYCENLQVLTWVMDRVECEDETPLVKEKALYAVACLLRDNPSGVRTFLTDWGLSWIFDLTFTTANVNLLKKCRFIIHAIYHCHTVDEEKKYLTPTETMEHCSKIMSRLRNCTCIATRNVILHIYWSILSAQKEILFDEFTSAEFGLVHIVKEYLGEYDNIFDPYYSPDAGELYDVLLEFQRTLKC